MISSTRTTAGAVSPSSSITPRRSACSASLPTTPRTRTSYSFSTWKRGWSNRPARSPSLVSSSSPVLSRSSLPTGNTRARVGTHSTTVRRPLASVAALSTPAGLFRSQYSLGSAAIGRPSTAMSWMSGSADAPSSAVTPSIVTLPALISSSLARREAKPASRERFLKPHLHERTSTRVGSAIPGGGAGRPSGPPLGRTPPAEAARPDPPDRTSLRSGGWSRRAARLPPQTTGRLP